MISFELGVEDLADTRFAISPIEETALSLRVLREPGLYALHLPWRRSVRARLDPSSTDLLTSLVGPDRAIPDFLTPRPTSFAATFEEELAVVRQTPAEVVRRDVLAAYPRHRLPEVLRDMTAADDGPVHTLRDTVCDHLHRYWDVAIRPSWPQLRLVLEADMTYRARQLAVGGARLLFADMHPNLRWHNGVLHIDKMIGRHRVVASGRGLLLLPSVFAHKPTPPLWPAEPPVLTYPCRGVATLWAPSPTTDVTSLAALVGTPKARLLGFLDEPLATVEIARRLRVTPSAVSQHLRVLNATGLITRARDGRHVLYRRSPLGDQLVGQ
ncbi:helix-turn-helix domain-containing protein [Plantactinospora sp. GCM10030261]|uniref:ArsR/SmtB family transcription factor n=1 Tax=Plantactinospora sp. GCM10030261 TaxID=3273420 RepID=UPI00360AC6E2